MSPKTCPCGNMFTPQYKSTQKHCSVGCFYRYGKARIPKISDNRKVEVGQYSKERREFLIGKKCPITGGEATEIHHMKGRTGKWLNDKRYWLAVSREGHIKIEMNPLWAKQQGYSLKR